MIVPRRSVLALGGAIAAWCWFPLRRLSAVEAVEIEMRGRKDGSRVWFDPIGLHVAPGTTIRWTNRDPGNAHTVTAYHPRIEGRQQRIPDGAEPWDSDYLLPGESFAVTLVVPGVYDYYCQPHEQAGMVGRIVVGNVADLVTGPAENHEAPPEVALRAFPPISVITLNVVVHPH